MAQHHDVQGVEQLALVLMQALGLDVEHEVRGNGHVLPALEHVAEGDLVVPLDAGELLAEGGVVPHGQQVAQALGLAEPAVADGVADQAGQRRVAAHQPAAVGDAVGDGGELLRHQLIVIVEGLVLEDLPVQLADAVDGVAH